MRAMEKASVAVAEEVVRLSEAPVCCRSWHELSGEASLEPGARLRKFDLSNRGAVAEVPGGRSRYLLVALGEQPKPFGIEIFLERKAHSMFQWVMSAFVPRAQFLDADRQPIGEPLALDYRYDDRLSLSGFFATLEVTEPGAAYVALVADPSSYGKVVATDSRNSSGVMSTDSSFAVIPMEFDMAIMSSPQGKLRLRIK